MKIAVVGAGIAGRMLAWLAGNRGHAVTIYDSGESGCSEVAAGLLAPFCELDRASARIHQLGAESLERWEALARGGDFYFQRAGTLVVAAPGDRAELLTLEQRVGDRWRASPAELEPELGARFRDGLYFPAEGQLEPRACLAYLRKSARARRLGRARDVGAGVVDDEFYDEVVDCRGLAARTEWRELRGVRGEILRVHAPEVALSRPVRVAHPRFALYVAPRPEARFVIGATCLESEARGPVRVRSALELLSAAYALHPGFGEAEIEAMHAELRPALPDHEPGWRRQPGLMRVNGLYRHGFLIAPRFCELALDCLEGAA